MRSLDSVFSEHFCFQSRGRAYSLFLSFFPFFLPQVSGKFGNQDKINSRTRIDYLKAIALNFTPVRSGISRTNYSKPFSQHARLNCLVINENPSIFCDFCGLKISLVIGRDKIKSAGILNKVVCMYVCTYTIN